MVMPRNRESFRKSGIVAGDDAGANAPRAVVAFSPVCREHGFGSHRRTCSGGMDEPSIADENADMGKRLAKRVIEDQIAWFESFRRDRLSVVALRFGIVRKQDAKGFPEYVSDQPAAIETRGVRFAAIAVVDANRPERAEQGVGGQGMLGG